MIEDVQKVTRMWNEFFSEDQVTVDDLKSRFYDNEFVKPILPSYNETAFSLAASRGNPFFYESNEEGKGWILGAGFNNQREDLLNLMNVQFEEFARMKIGRVYYSNMVPTYFLPGVDDVRYPQLKLALLELGFRQVQRVISMESGLEGATPETRPINGIDVSAVRDAEKSNLLTFIGNNFPADWYFRAKEVLEHGISEQVVVARRLNKIVGYGMFSAGSGTEWYASGERFGPFGVLESERSNGIGSMILINLIGNMKKLKLKKAYFLWTDERATHIYKRFGFNISRTFAIMEKVLF